jgi:histidinol-phosphate aminotransferase
MLLRAGDASSSAPRTHGGLPRGELRELGIAAEDVVDFSVSCNPYGPCAAVVDAIRGAPIERYPDPAATEAREALAAVAGVARDQIALGNGAAELLWTLASALVHPGDAVVIVEPAFGELRAAAEHAGARVCEWRARAGDGFAVDLAAVSDLIDACRARLAYVCMPGTPTGAAVPAAGLAALAAAHPATTIVVDQSFLSLSARHADADVRMPDNAICVRSLTKDHAIPGVRVGYALGSAALIARVEHGRAAWTTGAAAQAAAIAACATGSFVADSRDRLLAERVQLVAMLGSLGLAAAPSSTGFVAVRTGDASGVRRRLLARHRLLVRDCSSFGLPEHIRLAARSAVDRERLRAALVEEVSR